MHQILTRASRTKAMLALPRISLQPSVIASQFTAGLAPHTLIQQLNTKIGFVVLSLIAMIEVGAAEFSRSGTTILNTPPGLRIRQHSCRKGAT